LAVWDFEIFSRESREVNDGMQEGKGRGNVKHSGYGTRENFKRKAKKKREKIDDSCKNR
jgi:hypothetical protein